MDEPMDVLEKQNAKLMLQAKALYRNEKRQKEFICARLALGQLLGKMSDVEYDNFRKPYVKNYEGHISISHSEIYVLVAKSNIKMGVDIEQISLKLDRVKHKFCSKEELSTFNQSLDVRYLGLVWSAKESMYKAIGNYPFLFEQEMQTNINTIETQGEFSAKVSVNSCLHPFQVYYQFFKDCVFTVAEIQM